MTECKQDEFEDSCQSFKAGNNEVEDQMFEI